MRTYLTGVKIVNVRQGDVLSATCVVIDDGRVTRIGGNVPRETEDSEVIDAGGAFVVPGLWNVHTHMGGMTPSTVREHHESSAERTIRAGHNLLSAFVRGITGIRNVVEPGGIDLAWRDAIRKGLVMGPNLFVCGQGITPTGGHIHDYPGVIQADGPAEFRKAVRSQLAKGVDQIKLMVSGGIATPNESLMEAQALTDEIEAVVDVVHRKGKRVTVHAGGSQSIKEAVRAGVDCIEHGYALDEEAVALMLERHTFYVPTLFVTSPHSVKSLSEHGADSTVIEKARQGAATHLQSFRMALRAGLRIVVGADTNPIGENTFIEIELLAQHGMPPQDALRAATANAAELCGAENETGSIDVGKLADLLVVAGNPLDDVSKLRNTVLVVRAGRVVSDPHRLSQRATFLHPFVF